MKLRRKYTSVFSLYFPCDFRVENLSSLPLDRRLKRSHYCGQEGPTGTQDLFVLDLYPIF
jgi:hypothetical protein